MFSNTKIIKNYKKRNLPGEPVSNLQVWSAPLSPVDLYRPLPLPAPDPLPPPPFSGLMWPWSAGTRGNQRLGLGRWGLSPVAGARVSVTARAHTLISWSIRTALRCRYPPPHYPLDQRPATRPLIEIGGAEGQFGPLVRVAASSPG